MPRKGERDLIWEVLAELFCPSGVSPCNRGVLNKAREELRYKSNVSPEQVRVVFWGLKRQWSMPFGPMALVLHWDDFTPRAAPRKPVNSNDVVLREAAEWHLKEHGAVPPHLVAYVPKGNGNGRKSISQHVGPLSVEDGPAQSPGG
jgi:hypothetical protein